MQFNFKLYIGLDMRFTFIEHHYSPAFMPLMTDARGLIPNFYKKLIN